MEPRETRPWPKKKDLTDRSAEYYSSRPWARHLGDIPKANVAEVASNVINSGSVIDALSLLIRQLPKEQWSQDIPVRGLPQFGGGGIAPGLRPDTPEFQKFAGAQPPRYRPPREPDTST